MRRSKKLDRIHSLLVLLFSIICITGAVFLCYDKCVVAYICWFVCILIVPCAGVLNFESRSALWEEAFNEIKNKEQNKELDQDSCDQQYPSDYINDR
jgi:hypothetical protein